jgi:hypothetical protein
MPGEEVLIAILADVTRADHPLEPFRFQVLAGPLQFSDHLLHAAGLAKCARSQCSLARAAGLVDFKRC